MKFKKKSSVLFVVFLVIVGVFLFYLLVIMDEADELVPLAENSQSLPIPNIEEYVEEFNEGLNQSQKMRKERDKNKTPEMIAAEISYSEKLVNSSMAAIQDIIFYGKVIDQFGDPVSGAKITYVGQGVEYARGSGTQYTKTDDQGMFFTNDMQGVAFVVEKIEKDGYQFSLRERFLNNYGHARDGQFWEDYSTQDKPFVFNAWKVAGARYPNVSRARGNYGFKPGKTYSMDFSSSNKKKVKKEGKLNLDLQVLFNHTEEGWSLSLYVPNGGLIETDGLYMNEAPVSGYQRKFEFSGTGKKEIFVEKKYYIHSRGRLYGRLKVRIRPYTNRGSGITVEHVMNLDGGRNLEVK